MKKLRKAFAIVFMATMMTVSASFAGMAETAVDVVSEESHDTAEENTSDSSVSTEDSSDSAVSDAASDTSSDGSFETTDKTVEDNDSVEFDEEDAPEIEKEEAEEIETTVSSGSVIEVTKQDDISVTVDEIVVEKAENNVIISSESETIISEPTDSSYVVTEKTPDLESDIQFETTSKVVEDVDVVEFDDEPIKNETIVTPEVPKEDVPTDIPPVVETPEPEKPQPEVPVTPDTEKPVPDKLRPNHDNDNDHDDYDGYEVTVVSTPIPVIPAFVEEPAPRIIEKPVFADEPAARALPKTGDITPMWGHVFAFSLIALIIICLYGETAIIMNLIKCLRERYVMKVSCCSHTLKHTSTSFHFIRDWSLMIRHHLMIVGLFITKNPYINLFTRKRSVTERGIENSEGQFGFVFWIPYFRKNRMCNWYLGCFTGG